MASYLLKCPDADFDRWRLAAKDRGLTMAAFLRLAADLAAAKDAGRVVYPPVSAAVAAGPLLARIPERAFRPDPRPGSRKPRR